MILKRKKEYSPSVQKESELEIMAQTRSSKKSMQEPLLWKGYGEYLTLATTNPEG